MCCHWPKSRAISHNPPPPHHLLSRSKVPRYKPQSNPMCCHGPKSLAISHNALPICCHGPKSSAISHNALPMCGHGPKFRAISHNHPNVLSRFKVPRYKTPLPHVLSSPPPHSPYWRLLVSKYKYADLRETIRYIKVIITFYLDLYIHRIKNYHSPLKTTNWFCEWIKFIWIFIWISPFLKYEVDPLNIALFVIYMLYKRQSEMTLLSNVL